MTLSGSTTTTEHPWPRPGVFFFQKVYNMAIATVTLLLLAASGFLAIAIYGLGD